MKHIWPYVLIIFLFNILFVLTVSFNNQDLYFGYGQNLQEVITNNKIPIQREIFIYGLVIIMTILNVFERLFTEQSHLLKRAIKTILTVIIIYLTNWFIFEILDTRVICLYYYYSRGVPAPIYFFIILVYLIIILAIFEIFTKLKVFKTFQKMFIRIMPDFITEYFKTY